MAETPPRRSNDWLRQHKAGELLHLVVRREGTELKIDFHLVKSRKLFMTLPKTPVRRQGAAHREGLLHGVTDAPTMHAAN